MTLLSNYDYGYHTVAEERLMMCYFRNSVLVLNIKSHCGEHLESLASSLEPSVILGGQLAPYILFQNVN